MLQILSFVVALLLGLAPAVMLETALSNDENMVLNMQEQVTELPAQNSSVFYGDILRTLGEIYLVPNGKLEQELESWKQVNAQVTAIIQVPELGINEPVVQATVDNKQWLRTNIKGEPDLAGTVFFDVRCQNQESPIRMVHGHNMKDGTMFANVPDYLKLASCKDAPKISLVADGGVAEYQVYSVISVNSKEEALPLDFLTSYEDIEAMTKDLLMRSLVPDGVITSHDTLVLNTCWYGASGMERNLHCVVVASRV